MIVSGDGFLYKFGEVATNIVYRLALEGAERVKSRFIATVRVDANSSWGAFLRDMISQKCTDLNRFTGEIENEYKLATSAISLEYDPFSDESYNGEELQVGRIDMINSLLQPVDMELFNHPDNSYNPTKDVAILMPEPGLSGVQVVLEGRRYWISRKQEDHPQRKDQTVLFYEVETLGRGKDVFNPLLNYINETLSKPSDKIPIWVSNGSNWTGHAKKLKRSINTVFLDHPSAREVLDDCKKFFRSKAQYQRLGTPWRRGYLLKGVPGSGKSSLIHAIASELDLALYMISLDKLSSDRDLLSLFAGLNSRAIIVLEDIDVIPGLNVNRDDDDTGVIKDGDEYKPYGISLSTLLNVIDGAFAGEDRLLFMTTNRPESIDSALIRPGRIDVEVEFGYATIKQLVDITELYYPTHIINRVQIAPLEGQVTISQVQQCYQVHIDEPERGIVKALELLRKEDKPITILKGSVTQKELVMPPPDPAPPLAPEGFAVVGEVYERLTKNDQGKFGTVTSTKRDVMFRYDSGKSMIYTHNFFYDNFRRVE